MPINEKLHPYWYVWGAMIQRCTNPNHPSYKNYGGRGITVCERWRKLANFEADMGPRPFPGASIERVENDKGYCPENCVWATTKEQAKNKRIALGESGYRGVVRNKSGWAASYYDIDAEEVYHLGTFDTPEAARDVRQSFIEAYENDVESAMRMVGVKHVRRDSSTGVTGVSPTKNGKFFAYYTPKGGKRIGLGYFSTIEEAANAREEYIRARTKAEVVGTEG